MRTDPMNPYAVLFIAHVVGQLTRRYFCPTLPRAVTPTVLSFQNWSRTKWRSFVARLAADEGADWLRAYLIRGEAAESRLAECAHEQLRWCTQEKAYLVPLGSPLYPPLLAHIADPPLFLTVLGSPHMLTQSCVSIVGARRAHPEVLEQCHRLALRLAPRYAIVSGGAYGCDIVAHQACLSYAAQKRVSVPAVVVFAGGLDTLYPQANKQVFLQLLHGGAALISERLWYQKARPFDFPVRNRIIAGCSQEIIVMQAAHKSGTYVTAQRALDQGREVLVYAATQDSVLNDGVEALTSDGAYAFASIEELLLRYAFAR